MSVEPGWSLALALILLVALGTGALLLGRVKVAWQVPWAAIRAAVQLLLISYVVGWAVSSPEWAFALVGVMFTVGVVTTARRVGLDSPRAWAAAALAMGAGAAPVLAIIFGSGAAPLVGVLLGGGTPLEAGAAQVLVLVGVVAGQPLTALVARELMSLGWLLPRSLQQQLHS